MKIKNNIINFLPLYLASLLLICIPFLSHTNCFAATDKKSISLEEVWDAYIPNYLSRIDITNASSLYGAQTRLMVPVWALFRLGRVAWQRQITSVLLRILNATITLSRLRDQTHAGTINISEDLLDETTSGSGKRWIFPFERRVSQKGDYGIFQIYEKRLSQLQFSYLVAYHARLLVQNKPLGIEFERFVNKATNFLLNDIVRSYWLAVPAWHWVKGYPNMKERLEAKLTRPLPEELRSKSFYKMIVDEDLFLMAIAAELRCISMYQQGILIKEDDLKLIEDILSIAEITVFSRLQKGNGFLFDVGSRDDHLDHAYAGYNGNTFPTSKSPAINISQDISHSQRWPWWLSSFRDAWPVNSLNYRKYHELINRLAYQFVNHVLVWQDNGFPLVTNYLDGKNGWYRVGYKNKPSFGYSIGLLSYQIQCFEEVGVFWLYMIKASESLMKEY